MFDQDLHPLFLSLKIASVSIIFIALFGISIAYFMSKKEFRGKSVIEAIFLLPLVLPPTVMGFGLLLLFGKNGPIGSFLAEYGLSVIFHWTGAVIAAIVVSFPMMYQSAQAAFKVMDPRLEKAAMTMGASKWRIFFTITLPIVWPGLLAGIVLAFARALGEFGATLMLAGYIPGKTDTIPLVIYFAVQNGQMEKAAFWVGIIVAVGFITILWLNWWTKNTVRRFAHQDET